MDNNYGNRGVPRRPLNEDKDANILFNQEESKNHYQGFRPSNDRDEEEALEDNGVDFQEEAQNDDEDNIEGDDLEENMEDDYQHNSQLDKYDGQGIDDQMQDELDIHGRAEVDQRLEREERMRAAM